MSDAGNPIGPKKPKIAPSLLTSTMVKEQPIQTQKTSLRIGIPREPFPLENRVALTPQAVEALVANGHEVYLEHKAGEGSNFTNEEYTAGGAVIVYSKEEVYNRADIITKISPPKKDECELIRKSQTLISAVNMGQITADYVETLVGKGVTAIGYEFIRSADGSIPFLEMVSQIAGVGSINIAAELLAAPAGGKGLLMGGITGVPPVNVAIVGAGTVGMNAARTALALGASVRVLDIEVFKLRELERVLNQRVYTEISSQAALHKACKWADVVIGAAYIKGLRAPVVITEDMVNDMVEGAVIIDVAIDQGGCVETSKRTDHRKPYFVYEGVTHYCVPNIASRVARTGSKVISNLLMPMLLSMGKRGGVKQSVGRETSITTGIYVYHKHVTHRALADLYGHNFMDIELLYASDM